MPLYQVDPRPASPYVGSIADLIGQAAAIQADKVRQIAAIQGNEAMRRGYVNGSTISSLGELGANTIGGILQAKQQQKSQQALNDYLNSGQVTIGGLVAHGFSPKDAATFVKATTPEPLKPAQIDTTDEQGNAVTKFVTPEVGASFPKPAPKEKPAGTREITVNTPEGGTIHKIVPDVAGLEFPSPPPPAKPKDLSLGAPQTAIVNGQRALIRAGSDGGVYDVKGNKLPDDAKVDPIPERPVAGENQSYDAKTIAQGIADGSLSPDINTRSKDGLAVLTELQKMGYDHARALTDWKATQKYVSTLNGAQQVRLGQAVETASHSLDVIEELASKWKGGKFPILNRVNLAAAKNGAYGDEVASVAQQLSAQISDLTSELGNVYMGGNSPTDHALKLAGQNLSADWSEKVLKDMVKLARTNLSIRQNSMRTGMVAGTSANNPYAPPTPPAPAVAAPKEGTEGNVGGVPAVWKTVNGVAGWYKK